MRKTVLSSVLLLGPVVAGLAWWTVGRALRVDGPVDALALPGTAAERDDGPPRPEREAVVPVAPVRESAPATAASARERGAPRESPARSAPVVPPGLVGEGFDESPVGEPAAEPAVGPSQALVTGLVVRPNGAPIDGAAVALIGTRSHSAFRDSSGRWRHGATVSATCDESGRFRALAPVRPGMQWELELQAPQHGPDYVRLGSLEGGSETELGDLVLSPSAIVRGRYLDARGHARSVDVRERIVVRSLRFPAEAGGFREVGRVRTEAGGRFTVDELPAGPITIEVVRGGERGRRTAFAFADAEAGQAIDVEVPAVEDDGARLWVETRVAHGLAAWPDPARVSARGERGGERRASFEAGAYVFDGLVDAEVDLRIADERFRSWERLGVDTDEGHVIAELEGTSRLVVQARDARTRAVLSGVRLKLRALGTDTTYGVGITGERSGDATLYRGIPGGAWVANVRAPGYAAADVQVPDLAPGEERTIVALLSDGVPVSGRVRFPRDVPGPLGRPARVELYTTSPYAALGPLELGADAAARRGFLDALAERRVHRVPPVDTDEDGAFELAGVLPGRYLVSADLGHGCIAVRCLAVGREGVADADLVLPLARRLVGRLDVPSTHEPTRFVLTGTSRSDREARPVRVALDRQGYFASAPLPPGPAGVRLGYEPFPSALVGDALRLPLGTSIELADVEIPVDADAPVEFEALAEHLPARLTVACDVRGDADGTALVAEAFDPLDRTRGDGARLALDGRAELAVFAGRYDVRVRALDGSWCRHAPEPVELDDGESATQAFEVELWRARVRCVDGDGRPLAARELEWWRPQDGTGFTARGRTDADGSLVLTLPPGAVHFALTASDPGPADGAEAGSPATGARAVVEWGAAEDGDVTVVLGSLTNR